MTSKNLPELKPEEIEDLASLMWHAQSLHYRGNTRCSWSAAGTDTKSKYRLVAKYVLNEGYTRTLSQTSQEGRPCDCEYPKYCSCGLPLNWKRLDNSKPSSEQTSGPKFYTESGKIDQKVWDKLGKPSSDGEKLDADTIRKWWRFDIHQEPLSSWHEREEFIAKFGQLKPQQESSEDIIELCKIIDDHRKWYLNNKMTIGRILAAGWHKYEQPTTKGDKE